MSVRRRSPRQLALRVAGALALVVLATSGVGHAVVSSAEDRVRRVDPFAGLRDRPGAGHGLNILVIGTDSREGMTAAERDRYSLGHASCYCADAILLLHLAESGEQATVVSLPRDTRATLPAHTFAPTGDRHTKHPDKLNAALSHGGPKLMVRTVEEMTDIRVDHYLEVSMAGFMRAVDRLGGVEVCVAEPLRDRRAGLELPAGTTRLDGRTALAYVRARHLDGDSDLGRMRRQQEFLAAFVDQAIRGKLLDQPEQLRGMAGDLLDSVRADPGFGAKEMLKLARALEDLKPATSRFTSVPVADTQREEPGLGKTVTWERPEADYLFSALREDRTLPRPGGDKPAERAGTAAKDGKDSGSAPAAPC